MSCIEALEKLLREEKEQKLAKESEKLEKELFFLKEIFRELMRNKALPSIPQQDKSEDS